MAENELPSPADPVRELDAFFRSGSIVCEFGVDAAREGSIRYCVLPATETPGVDPIRAEVRAFLKTRMKPWKKGDPSAVVAVAEEIPADEERQYEIVSRLRDLVMAAIMMEVANYPEPPSPEQEAEALRAARVVMPDHPGIIGPSCKHLETVMFAMGPAYKPDTPPTHRRYAPRVNIPLTLRGDAETLSEMFPEKRERTLAAAEDRSGKPVNMDFPFYDEVIEIPSSPPGPESP